MISINTACGASLISLNSGNGGKDVKKLQSKSDDKKCYSALRVYPSVPCQPVHWLFSPFFI